MIVDTEKVLREADGSVKLVVVRPHTDGKVFAPGCASKPDGESREPEEHKRTSQPMLFPKHPIPEGLLRPSFVTPRRKEGLPDIWVPLQLLVLKN